MTWLPQRAVPALIESPKTSSRRAHQWRREQLAIGGLLAAFEPSDDRVVLLVCAEVASPNARLTACTVLPRA
ncbi:MAG TPA: hypothetical protein VI299_05690 [Polyangiales bacterium]